MKATSRTISKPSKLQSNIHVLSFLHASVKVASISVFGIGLLVLSGWIMDISALRSILPGLPAVRFNTALTLLLLSSSLWLLQDEEAGIRRRRADTGSVCSPSQLVDPQ